MIPVLSVAGINAEEKKNAYVKSVMLEVMHNPKHPCQLNLIPDPTNPYDPQAVKIQLNSTDIGYVAKSDQQHIDITKEYAARIESWGVLKDQSVYIYFQPIHK